jgi:anaerobic magnesium-protoporphyrin IX monomethyl ester cyclase
MKTVLAALNAKYVHSSLSIRYIRSYSSNEDIEIFDTTINENPLNIATEILMKQPDLVGFSCYIWNFTSGYSGRCSTK